MDKAVDANQSSNPLVLRGEAVDLLEAYLVSPACQLIKRLKVFELTLRVFRGNYADWQRVIEQYRPDSPLAALGMMHTPRNWVEAYLVELTRALHNLAASAFTLVDHTRNLYKELYEAAGTMPQYQPRVDADFTDDGLARFVGGLRNYCVHDTLPLIGVSLGVQFDVEQGSSTKWSVPLNTARLLAWDGWHSEAKKFLKAAGARLNLGDTIQKYHDKVESFQQWFQEQQRAVHHAEFDQQANTSHRIARLQELARFYEWAAANPDGPTHAFTDEELRPVAFEMYEEDNRLHGRVIDGKDLEDWFRAVGRLTLLRQQEVDPFAPA